VSSPFVAEIRMFGFNFAPTGWAQCNGQLLPISQNTALFSLLGTFYGGDGKSTFALPNLQDSCAIFWGQGGGLSLYDLGQQGGSETVTLLISEIPAHTHTVKAAPALVSGDTNIAPGNAFAKSSQGNAYTPLANQTNLSFQAVSAAGGDLPHNNMMPFLTVNYCIAMQGVFPPRT
jgi:microcystin-dependent protein